VRKSGNCRPTREQPAEAPAEPVVHIAELILFRNPAPNRSPAPRREANYGSPSHASHLDYQCQPMIFLHIPISAEPRNPMMN